ncbi:MAG: hypothetical protein F4Y87_05830 [Synechococcus sp. SB0665_bin_28]|nr:hypothetical protein [Synechococcus sp. SB0665_bin_28]MYF20218.1 hypothetical protein [Synechococcus sp. SB0677_bin_5]
MRLVPSSALPPWFLESHLQGIPHHRHWVHRDVGAIRWDALTFAERAKVYGAIYRRAQGVLRMPLGLAMDWGLPEVSLGLVLPC